MHFDKPITTIKGIGTKRAELFLKLGIKTIADLLRFYPKQNSYLFLENLRNLKTITFEEKNVCLVTIMSLQKKVSRRGLRFTAIVVKDEFAYAEVMLFGAQAFQANSIKVGEQVLITATAHSKQGKIILSDAVIKQSFDLQTQLGIMPTYSLVHGLTQGIVHKTMAAALQAYCPQITESLPDTIQKQFHLIEISTALQNIHFPQNRKLLQQAQKRLIFEELFYLQFALHKQNLQNKMGSIVRQSNFSFAQKLLATLPFELTCDQQKVWEQIQQDCTASTTMQMLLQGDVGSGKTIIAALTALTIAEQGGQTAILVPTEILARQHFKYFQEICEQFNLKVALLIGNMNAKERKAILQDLRQGNTAIVIGTHAILQPDVLFSDLRLAIIDEQHRFGVQQRQALFDKSPQPVHLLAMSATPIPRTLALALYGNLDISTIKTMPAHRKPIQTLLYTEEMRDAVYRGAVRQVQAGKQVYVVCPLIDEESELNRKSAEQVYEELLHKYFSPQECTLLHGRMSSSEKENIMNDFALGNIKVLVSTTVIEVGINVPNASLMIIEDAELFGLAQLHQLRGRVGRGDAQSYCALLTTQKDNPDSMQRLGLVVKYSDGFILAEQDLLLRGAGELLGTRQHGFDDLHLASIIRDAELLLEISAYIKKLTAHKNLFSEITTLQQNSLMNYKSAQNLN